MDMRRTITNGFHHLAGIGFLALAKAKHVLQGYSTPKPFGLSDIDRCIDYDIQVAQHWLQQLQAQGCSIQGKVVLELGPGSDLGTGAYLLHKGAGAYIAFDRHPLAANAPPEFYARLVERFPVDPSRLKFLSREDFDLSRAIPAQSIDIVVSNAAFEHFDDCARTIRQLSAVVKPGGVIVTVIDLQTHSRWIREADPNNIYRYPEWLYRLFYFPGQPNRLRPYQYRALFAEHGWKNVLTRASAAFDAATAQVRAAFRDPKNEMHCLSVVLFGQRDGTPQ